MLPVEQLVIGLLMTKYALIKNAPFKKQLLGILNGVISAVHVIIGMQSVSVKVHHLY